MHLRLEMRIPEKVSTTGYEADWAVDGASTTRDKGTGAVNNASTTEDDGTWR